MNASNLSELMIKLIEIMSDGQYHFASNLSEQCETNARTIRATLQRMNVFGLIEETIDPTSNLKRKAYKLTKSGKTILGKTKDVKAKKVSPIIPNPNQNLISWLRAMSEAHAAMADQLEAYDE